MLLSVVDHALMVAFAGWLLFLLVVVHLNFLTKDGNKGIIFCIITLVLFTMIVQIVITEQKQYDVMAERIMIGLAGDYHLYETSYTDCLLQTEIDQLVGHLWRTSNYTLMVKATQLPRKDHLCTLQVNKH